MSRWESHRIWEKRGNGFLIQIKHEVDAKDWKFKNNWFIYAYIYPRHPLFVELNKSDDMSDNAASDLPFHRGISYFNYLEHNGKVTAFQIGCDYMHYRDNYRGMNDEYIAFFQDDAQKLFDALSETNEVES